MQLTLSESQTFLVLEIKPLLGNKTNSIFEQLTEMTSTTSSSTVNANYSANSGFVRQTFTQTLPEIASVSSSEEKTHYLASLRSSTIQMQKDVNDFLTQKMEEDKTSTASQADRSKDEKEEENYGEETDET